MNKTFFVAGTDTDAGKTVVSCAILQACNQRGMTTIGFKPVAAGCAVTRLGLRNSDALHLQEKASQDLSYHEVNPFALMTPSSPHIAAQLDCAKIDEQTLTAQLAAHQSRADLVLVEGAGGWRVPVAHDRFLSSWVAQQQLPVILVVGIKLGCLNHALLSQEVITGEGVTLAGWVANCVDPDAEYVRANIDFLEQHITAPKLGEIPFMDNIMKQDLARYIDVDVLR